jgi:uncharacterized protein (DUF2141 family)
LLTLDWKPARRENDRAMARDMARLAAIAAVAALTLGAGGATPARADGDASDVLTTLMEELDERQGDSLAAVFAEERTECVEGDADACRRSDFIAELLAARPSEE